MNDLRILSCRTVPYLYCQRQRAWVIFRISDDIRGDPWSQVPSPLPPRYIPLMLSGHGVRRSHYSSILVLNSHYESCSISSYFCGQLTLSHCLLYIVSDKWDTERLIRLAFPLLGSYEAGDEFKPFTPRTDHDLDNI